jgi:hypothetical protein
MACAANRATILRRSFEPIIARVARLAEVRAGERAGLAGFSGRASVTRNTNYGEG